MNVRHSSPLFEVLINNYKARVFGCVLGRPDFGGKKVRIDSHYFLDLFGYAKSAPERRLLYLLKK